MNTLIWLAYSQHKREILIMANIIANIPFSGFYQSVHDGAIEQAIILEKDNDTDFDESKISFPHAFKQYANDYTNLLSKEIGIPFSFVELTSPKEYNFSTDVITVNIDEKEVDKMLNEADKNILSEIIADNCTSHSGFISLTSNNIDDWLKTPVTEFKPSQIELIIQAYIDTKFEDGHQDLENSISDDMQSNGYASNAIYATE